MSEEHDKPTYYELEIIAETPSTEIWLGDDGGSLVVQETGRLREPLLPGNYVVEFGLGTPCYPVPLFEHSSYTQAELRRNGPCERPVFELSEEEEREYRNRPAASPEIRALLDKLLGDPT